PVGKLVSPSVQLPSSWRVRGVTARRRLATSRPLGVKRSSGSAVRLPTRVTRSVSAMWSLLGAVGRLVRGWVVLGAGCWLVVHGGHLPLLLAGRLFLAHRGRRWMAQRAGRGGVKGAPRGAPRGRGSR